MVYPGILMLYERICYNAVLKIPLGKLQEDIWAWNAEKHGSQVGL
jgi:hypothetical protein